MNSLSLDGGSRYIGTEFLKLEITGTSELATEQYVDTAVANGSGGGDSYTQAQIDGFLANKADTSYVVGNFYTQSQVDTSLGLKSNSADVYTQTEVDNTVNGKVDLTNLNQVITGNITVLGNLELGTGNSIKCNTINTNGDVNLNFQQNSVNFMYFDATADKIELNTPLNSNSDIASTILKGETLSNYNANGLTLDTTTNSIYIKNNTATKIEVQSDKVIVSDPLNCNIFNSDGDNDITFKRNDIEYCKLREDGTVRLLEFPSNGGVSANQLYGNYFNNRSFGWDTIFQGSNTTSDGRVEYMRYDFTNEVIQLPKKLLVNGGDGKTEIYESVEATNNVFRIWNKETTNTPVIHIGAGATANDMVLSTGGFTFNKSVDCNLGLSVGENLTLFYNKKIVWGVNSIVETSSPTVPITRFDAPNTGSAYWFFVGPAVNDAYRIFTISNTEVLSKRVFKCNNIDSENNSDLVFKRNGKTKWLYQRS